MPERRGDTDVITRTKERVKEPEMYRVVLLNDDYTTREFVVAVLVQIFAKPESEATAIMMRVHRAGRGVVGVYSYDIAVSKAAQVHEAARGAGYPLQCIVEKA